MLRSSLCDYRDAPFTRFISGISNTYIDNAQDIDIIMPMYNLIEYSEVQISLEASPNIVKIYSS